MHTYLTVRVVACFLMELCLFHELECRLCPWAASAGNSPWREAGRVPSSEEDGNRGPGLAVSEVGAFALNTQLSM